MAIEATQDKLGITSLIKQATNVKAKQVMPKGDSKGFVRVKYIGGRPYYYLVKSIREHGKVKQRVLKYLGTRKPRGMHSELSSKCQSNNDTPPPGQPGKGKPGNPGGAPPPGFPCRA